MQADVSLMSSQHGRDTVTERGMNMKPLSFGHYRHHGTEERLSRNLLPL